MKLWKKLCITFLVALMAFFSVNVGNVDAKETVTTKKSVLSIDAGRKYFSEDQLKQIIDKAYKNGYTSVQILLGNDGLRFVLDDMSMQVNGKSYASEDVKKAITAGNNSYYADPNGDVLTEDEMDRIVAYAKERGLDIIPGINSPGHMDSILVAMEQLGLENVRYTKDGKESERTVNIENPEAIEFTQVLVKKYIDYFSASGVCEIFNFGADEYANDVFGVPGWGELQKLNIYDKFIDYTNDMAALIKEANMLPMCFNDGIYYNSDDKFGTFDKDIIISYWTAGWWGFDVAKPSYFAEKGHKILNTNDAWYWVLGNITSEDGIYAYENTRKNIEAKPYNELAGGSTVDTIGSMQAIWCDNPSKEHDMDRVLTLMDAFSEKHRDILVRPADYSKVDAALAKVPADLSIYTEETVKAVNDATAAVVRNLKETEQATVDGYAAAIENAVAKLELRKADYTKVDEAIQKAEKLNAKDYKNFDAVTKAVNAVVRDLDITKQAQVDAYAKAIEDAIAQLEKKTVTENISKPTAPQTGDVASPFTWMTLCVIAGGCVVTMKKRRA